MIDQSYLKLIHRAHQAALNNECGQAYHLFFQASNKAPRKKQKIIQLYKGLQWGTATLQALTDEPNHKESQELRSDFYKILNRLSKALKTIENCHNTPKGILRMPFNACDIAELYLNIYFLAVKMEVHCQKIPSARQFAQKLIARARPNGKIGQEFVRKCYSTFEEAGISLECKQPKNKYDPSPSFEKKTSNKTTYLQPGYRFVNAYYKYPYTTPMVYPSQSIKKLLKEVVKTYDLKKWIVDHGYRAAYEKYHDMDRPTTGISVPVLNQQIASAAFGIYAACHLCNTFIKLKRKLSKHTEESFATILKGVAESLKYCHSHSQLCPSALICNQREIKELSRNMHHIKTKGEAFFKEARSLMDKYPGVIKVKQKCRT